MNLEPALPKKFSLQYAKYDKDEAKVMERLQTIAHHVNAVSHRVSIIFSHIHRCVGKLQRNCSCLAVLSAENSHNFGVGGSVEGWRQV